MADTFRRLLDKKTGKGGVRCECCNWTYNRSNKARNRHRTELNKQVRSIMKIDLRNQINED